MGRILLSICAVLVAAGLGGSAQPAQPSDQPAGTAGSEASRNQRAPVMVTLAEPVGQGSNNNQEPGNTQEQSAPSPWLDLTAQSLMALFALGQVILTGVGILYIRKTLVSTDAAVGEAKRGSDAAVRMAAASQEQFAAERRPWMAQKTLKPVMPMTNMELAFEFRFQNAGASPAFDVALVVDIDVDDYSFTRIEESYQAFLKSKLARHKGGEVVFPGDDHKVTKHLQFSRRELLNRDAAWARRDIEKPGLTPRVFYAVFYRSPIRDQSGVRSVHHTGGFFSIMDWKGPILVGEPNPPEKIQMMSQQTTADFLLS